MDDFWNWVIGAIGLASSIVGIGYFAADIHNKRNFGWKHVEKLLKQMIRDIDRASSTPTSLLAWVAAGPSSLELLAGNLGYIPLYVIDTYSEKRSGIKEVRLRNTEFFPDIAGQRVLLVVGELYTGEDLRRGIEFIESRGAGDLRTMSLLTHPTASVMPDFYGIETAKPLTAPWRITAKYREARI